MRHIHFVANDTDTQRIDELQRYLGSTVAAVLREAIRCLYSKEVLKPTKRGK